MDNDLQTTMGAFSISPNDFSVCPNASVGDASNGS
jgi:hypothetical protein